MNSINQWIPFIFLLTDFESGFGHLYERAVRETRGLVFLTLRNTALHSYSEKGNASVHSVLIMDQRVGKCFHVWSLTYFSLQPTTVGIICLILPRTQTHPTAVERWMACSDTKCEGRLEKFEGIFKGVRNGWFTHFSPRREWWKRELCQGTLNPFSGKESLLGSGIPTVPSGRSEHWEQRSWSPCPAAQSSREDEQLRHTDEQPGLIQAAVDSSLAGPIQDFLQKYRFTAAGCLDFANGLTLGCTKSFRR